MAFVVIMVAGNPHGRAADSEFRLLQCGAGTWDAAVALGRQFAWHSEGTQPCDERSRVFYPQGFDHSYEVPDVLGAKVITRTDAAAWADALERALLSGRFAPGDDCVQIRLLVDGRSEAEHRMFNRTLSTRFVIDFITYLRRGGFTFYWDD